MPGLGNNATLDKVIEFTKPRSKNGLQVHAIPANISPADFSEFHVCCADASLK